MEEDSISSLTPDKILAFIALYCIVRYDSRAFCECWKIAEDRDTLGPRLSIAHRSHTFPSVIGKLCPREYFFCIYGQYFYDQK